MRFLKIFFFLSICWSVLPAQAQLLTVCDHLFKGEANPTIAPFGGDQEHTPLQAMANLLLKTVPREEARQIQVAFPVKLEKNDQQPQQFDDGQQNAFASFGPRTDAPYVAFLSRALDPLADAELSVMFSANLNHSVPIKTLEVSIAGKVQTVTLDEHGFFKFQVNPEALQWNELLQPETVYFKPTGWDDWFGVKFPQAYVSTQKLMDGMDPEYREISPGVSVVDPLGLAKSLDPAADLQKIEQSKSLGFVYVPHIDRVHGIYLPERGPTVLTSTGGVWTRYRPGAPFKIVYLIKDPRVVANEQKEHVVSGTGPHYIGAVGEVIVNSLGHEPLVTFYGIPGAATGPNGAGIAWGGDLNSLFIGTWLKPGQSFVAPQGTYHWHLNHLEGATVAAEVWTPPAVPNLRNFFGFRRE